MITDTCTRHKFVTAELNRGEYDAIHPRETLERALGLLDSSRFVMRDNDKFDLIARAMQQYCVDIKSLKTHMTINIGLVIFLSTMIQGIRVSFCSIPWHRLQTIVLNF